MKSSIKLSKTLHYFTLKETKLAVIGEERRKNTPFHYIINYLIYNNFRTSSI